RWVCTAFGLGVPFLPGAAASDFPLGIGFERSALVNTGGGRTIRSTTSNDNLGRGVRYFRSIIERHTRRNIDRVARGGVANRNPAVCHGYAERHRAGWSARDFQRAVVVELQGVSG